MTILSPARTEECWYLRRIRVSGPESDVFHDCHYHAITLPLSRNDYSTIEWALTIGNG